MGGIGTAPAIGFGEPELKRLAAELITMCADLFERRFGMRAGEARRQARKMVKRVRKDLHKHPLLNEPSRRGQRRLDRLRKTPAGVKYFQALQKEGVREADYICWWDHHILEQEVIRRITAVEQDHLLKQFTMRGIPAANAQAKIQSQLPIFGFPNAEEHTIGPHAPLPYELRKRVQAYLGQADPADVRQGIDRCLSMNAFLREQIKASAL